MARLKSSSIGSRRSNDACMDEPTSIFFDVGSFMPLDDARFHLFLDRALFANYRVASYEPINIRSICKNELTNLDSIVKPSFQSRVQSKKDTEKDKSNHGLQDFLAHSRTI